MKTLISLSLALATLASAPALAGDTAALRVAAPAATTLERFSYDKAHTQIFFSVNHLGYSFSRGQFKSFDGFFMLDEKAPENSMAEITIDANSLEMGDKVWNEHTQAKFLNGDKFPTITFKSAKVVRTGEKTADMTGPLTLHGVTKDVTLQVTLNGIGEHPMSKKRAAGFGLKGTLKRSDFGMAEALPMIGDEIGLDIQVEGVSDAAPVAAPVAAPEKKQ